MTNNTTVTFTSAGNPATSSYSDGVSVWMTDTASSTTVNIRKYPIAGGSASSTTTTTLAYGAYLNGSNPSLFLGGTSMLGISWAFNWCSATAVTGYGLHTTAITLP
jgi:hypothetical protein